MVRERGRCSRPSGVRLQQENPVRACSYTYEGCGGVGGAWWEDNAEEWRGLTMLAAEWGTEGLC